MVVVGEGPMADIYKSVVGMFGPLAGNSVTMDISPCMPYPNQPDWLIYKQIGRSL